MILFLQLIPLFSILFSTARAAKLDLDSEKSDGFCLKNINFVPESIDFRGDLQTIMSPNQTNDFACGFKKLGKTLGISSSQAIRFKGKTLVYVTPWNRRGYERAVTFSHKLDYISPAWFTLTVDVDQQGTPNPDSPTGLVFQGEQDINTEFLQTIKDKNLDCFSQFEHSSNDELRSSKSPKIVPRINFQFDHIDSQHHQTYIQLLLDLAVKHSFDGYVLDFASLMGFAKKSWGTQLPTIKSFTFALVEALAENNLDAVISLPPSELKNDPNAPDEPLIPIEDILALDESVALWSLMTYDFHHRWVPIQYRKEHGTSWTTYGHHLGDVVGGSPIAPSPWTSDSLQDFLFEVEDRVESESTIEKKSGNKRRTRRNRGQKSGPTITERVDSFHSFDWEQIDPQPVPEKYLFDLHPTSDAPGSSIKDVTPEAALNRGKFTFHSSYLDHLNIGKAHPERSPRIDPSKVLIGTHWYGTQWRHLPPGSLSGYSRNAFLNPFENPSPILADTLASYFESVCQNTCDRDGDKCLDHLTAYWDPYAGEHVFMFFPKEFHTVQIPDDSDPEKTQDVQVPQAISVWFPTPASFAYRLELANAYGVGIGIWEFGQGIDSFCELL